MDNINNTNYDIITNLVAELDEDKIMNKIAQFIQSNPSREEAIKIIAAYKKGMAIVGRKYEAREYFVGDIIYAGEIQGQILEMLKPIVSQISIESSQIKSKDRPKGSRNVGEQVFANIIKSSGYIVSTDFA